MYSELRPGPICSTIETLSRRIQERFPGSGLGKVAVELLRVAEDNQRVAERLRGPIWQVRTFTALAVVMLGALALWALLELTQMAAGGIDGVADLLQAADAGTNQLVLLSLAVLFLVSLETPIKRRAALKMLHQLRSSAHVVDMHQLTRDPEHALRHVANKNGNKNGVRFTYPDSVIGLDLAGRWEGLTLAKRWVLASTIARKSPRP